MKLKKIAAYISAVAIAVTMLFPAGASAGSVSAPTPSEAGGTALKWEKTFGTGYTNAPTPPALIDGSVYTAAYNKVYSLNASTGATEAASPALGGGKMFGYATHPVISDDAGNIYVSTYENGSTKIIKLGPDLKSVIWTSAGFEGQNISPVKFIDGRIYCGTFTNTSGGTYFCIDAETGKTVWKIKDEGGFYWAGAAILNGRIVFGSDSGAVYSISGSAADLSGLSTLKLGYGVRSTPVVSGDSVYLTAKSTKAANGTDGGSGALYRLRAGTDGTLSAADQYNIGESVNTPVVSDGYIFVGNSSGKLSVFTADLSEKISTSFSGPIQGEVLVSKNGSGLYSVYAACNSPKGGISFAGFSSDMSSVTKSGLVFSPVSAQYCLSPVVGGSDGTLYYKNDSGHIFAVRPAAVNVSPITGVKVTKAGYNSLRVYWKRINNAEKYQLFRSTSAKGPYTLLKTLPPSAGYYFSGGLVCGQRYYYKVRAYVLGGKYTSYSAAVTAVPVIPASKLSAYAGTRRITLKWNKVYGATGYRVFRATSSRGTYVSVKMTSSLSWINTGLAKGRRYYYKIRAYRYVNGKRIYGDWSNITYRNAI